MNHSKSKSTQHSSLFSNFSISIFKNHVLAAKFNHSNFIIQFWLVCRMFRLKPGVFIFQMFSSCHQQIKSIRRSTLSCVGPESLITQNLVNYFANRLQATSEVFGKSQNSYLNSKFFWGSKYNGPPRNNHLSWSSHGGLEAERLLHKLHDSTLNFELVGSNPARLQKDFCSNSNITEGALVNNVRNDDWNIDQRRWSEKDVSSLEGTKKN